MGRPRGFDRDLALETALDAFWRDGFPGVSVASLAQAMGIAPPSLYAAFGDKQTLFDEAVALYGSRLDEALKRNFAASTAAEAVERLLLSSLDHFTGATHPPGCLVMSEPLLAERRKATRRALLARLLEAVETGELNSVEQARSLSVFVDTVLSGMAAQARDGLTHDQLRPTVDLTIRAWSTMVSR